MKKAVVFIILCICILVLSACAAGGSKATFRATVDSVSENGMMVTTIDNKDFDKASVHILEKTKISLNGKEAKITDISAGDEVEIGFDGIVAESYPVQLTAETVTILKKAQ